VIPIRRAPQVLLGVLLAAGAVAQPAPARFAAVAEMCAAVDLKPGVAIVVAGYRHPEDGGGGSFRYDAASRAEPDGGAVFAHTKLPGRLLRVVDPEEDAYAEWFGAYGDGDSATPHADQDAINKCLRAYGRVRLRAKTYGVRGRAEPYNPNLTFGAIDLGPYYHIVGSGRDRTRIKLLDQTNPHGSPGGSNYFTLLYNRAFHESADHVVIRDLTIDCNFDHQDKQATIHCIGIRGGGALLERLNLRGYGTGRQRPEGYTRECFAVHQTLVYKAPGSCRRAAVMRDLDFTGCGHNGEVGSPVGEITHLALGGADNFDNRGWIMPQGQDPAWDPANGGENANNWWPSYGGLVENCVIHDEVYDPPTQQSPLNGITYGDCIGLTIRGNRVENWEGCAVFTMSWWNQDTTIVDNTFRNVTIGVALNMAGEKGQPIQCPQHRGVLVAHNTIELGSDPDAPWGMCGVSLYGADMPATLRMQGIHVRENTISGRAHPDRKGNRSCPIGIKIQILRPVYHDLRIEDNVLDLPDYVEGTWAPPEPNGLALMYYPLALWDEAVKQGHVVFRGNRSPEGKPLYPALVDWDFKQPAKRGRMPVQ